MEKPLLTGTLIYFTGFKEFQQEHIYISVFMWTLWTDFHQNYVIPKHCSRTLVFSWYGRLLSALSDESIYYVFLNIH